MSFERDQDKFYIPTGIPVVFNERTKEMVPFLIQVYSDSIIWRDEFTGRKLESLIESSGLDKSTIKDKLSAIYKDFEYNGWLVKLIDGDHYSAKRVVSIGEKFKLKEDLSRELFYETKLPFPMVDDKELFVSLTMNGENENLQTASMTFSRETENGFLDNIKIHIRNLIYSFHTNFNDISSYKNSKIYIEISGNVNLVDSSQKDVTGYLNINNIPDYSVAIETPSTPGLWIERL